MAKGLGSTGLPTAMDGPRVLGRILSLCAIRSLPSLRLSHALPTPRTRARDRHRWADRHISSETLGRPRRCSLASWLIRWPADKHESLLPNVIGIDWPLPRRPDPAEA